MIETIIPVFLFTLSMCITPGPNNIMLTASGINFGYVKTIPHILGIALGMIMLLILSALGLGTLFTIFPQLKLILKIAGSVYLLYFAFKIATAKQKKNEVSAKSRPLNVFEGMMFQFVNPKAVLINVTAIAAYTAEGAGFAHSVLIILVTYLLVCIPSISVWAGFGSLIGRIISDERSFRICNAALGGVTALSVIMIIH